MTCKDCICYDPCGMQSRLVQVDEHTWDSYTELDDVENYCPHFKNKSDYVTKDEIAQLMWERDKAIDQLRSYGVDFCQEKKELAEVKHGEWEEMVEHEHGGIKKFFFECSLCGRIECQKEPYCHCGAKMDGRSET